MNSYARARSALKHQAISTATRCSSGWPWRVALPPLALQHILPACTTATGYRFSHVLSLVLSKDLLRPWYGTVPHNYLETFSAITVLGPSPFSSSSAHYVDIASFASFAVTSLLLGIFLCSQFRGFEERLSS